MKFSVEIVNMADRGYLSSITEKFNDFFKEV